MSTPKILTPRELAAIARVSDRTIIDQAARGDSIATIDKHYAYLFDEDEADVMTAID